MEKKKLTNFEQMAEKGRLLFLGYDIDKIAGKYGTSFDDSFLYLSFFSRTYRIKKATGVVEKNLDSDVSDECSASWTPAGPGEALIFYDLFCYGKPYARASHTFVNINSLVHTISNTGNPGGGLLSRQDKRFEGHAAKLKEAGLRLGGIPWEKGDASFELPMFDFLNCRFQFWDADDEFPASASIFMDASILDYMHFETTWYVVTHLIDLIAEAAGL